MTESTNNTQFQEIVSNFSPGELSKLRRQFDSFDLDRNGSIDAEELDAVISSLRQQATEEEIKTMINEVDIDQNGTIEFPEFLDIIRGLQSGQGGSKFAALYGEVHELEEKAEARPKNTFSPEEIKKCLEGHTWFTDAEKHLSKKQDNVSKLVWTDEDYSVNIKKIDLQHKKMFQMLNDVELIINEKKDNTELGELLDGLMNYTVYHFATEENLFEKYSYEETRDHSIIHQAFCDKIGGMVEEFKTSMLSGKAREPVESDLTWGLLNFLRAWIVGHIQNEDRRYSKTLNDAGIL